ncbi:protein kinase [Streptomyces sp. NPDC089919]|uniref:protein kinase domain-containing protein n=1 Tax=Streptomyces sp. NPDC089919 TaxID=3155188 RepID=UPI00342056C3
MDQLAFGDPQQIGDYRLLARLGAGGMGQVFLARSARGRTVAVKLVHEDLARQPEFRDRFRREVAAARRVGGEWTAPVLDADTEAAVPWLATGYVAGPDLRTVVGRTHGPLPGRSVRILAAGLAHALRDVHAAGLVHRDLKPSNVLVTLDGPRVIDFGIARALDEDEHGKGWTRTGELIGSPGFLAPEQVRGEPVTAACDVFCLGSVLAYAASGVLPFGEAGGAGAGPAALLLRIAEAEPELAGVPEPLRGLVRDCLHKDPGARPTPADVLARVGAGETVADGKALEPWLPAPLVAQLGRHAVRLLDREDAGPVRETVIVPEPGSAPAAPDRPAVPAVPAQRTSAPAPVAPYGPGGYGAYGPSPGAFGGPAAGDRPGGTYPGPYGYGYDDAADGTAAPEADGRRTGSTVFLVTVAVVVAVLTGGSVWAFMNDRHPDDGPVPAPTAARSPGPAGTGSTGGTTGGVGAAAGGIPEAYLGSWHSAARTWRLELRAGAVGEQVMTLTKTDPAYTCTWTAALRSAGPPVELAPSQVASGDPATCGPGPWSRLTLRPDGTLERELVDSGKPPLRYVRDR